MPPVSTPRAASGRPSQAFCPSVSVVGVEPTRPFGPRVLSPSCLPGSSTSRCTAGGIRTRQRLVLEASSHPRGTPPYDYRVITGSCTQSSSFTGRHASYQHLDHHAGPPGIAPEPAVFQTAAHTSYARVPCADGENRTLTDLSARRVLSPLCLLFHHIRVRPLHGGLTIRLSKTLQWERRGSHPLGRSAAGFTDRCSSY